MTRLLVLAVVVCVAASAAGGEAAALESLKDKVSYSLGLNMGLNMKQQQLDIDPDVLLRGIKDALGGAEPALTEEQMREAMTTFEQQVRAKRDERMKNLAETNKKAGAAFLATNGKKEGVVTTKSGLQYQILRAGAGAAPKATDTVVTHYRGTLLDGTEFDSSARTGKPAEFRVDGVIAGWTEALQLMKVGAKWRLFVPSHLAYRENGAGRLIGPHATLVFDVELVEIK